jgi:hypothetical protein
VTSPDHRPWQALAAETRTALIIDEQLPPGLAANAAAVLAATLGHRVEHHVGPDAVDADGDCHVGIVTVPLPTLKAPQTRLADLHRRGQGLGLVVVGFTELAQRLRDYDEYLLRLAEASSHQLNLIAVGLHGPRKAVDSLTGSLPLLR